MSKVNRVRRKKAHAEDDMMDESLSTPIQTLELPPQIDTEMGSGPARSILDEAGFIPVGKKNKKKKESMQDEENTNKPAKMYPQIWSSKKQPPPPKAPETGPAQAAPTPTPSIATSLKSNAPHLKVDREVVAVNRLGETTTKLRSKKERLKMKKEALLDHLASSLPNDHEKTTQAKQAKKRKSLNALSSFSSEFSDVLNSLEDGSSSESATSIDHLNRKQQEELLLFAQSAQWKPTKKNLKSMQDDRAKFEQVMNHSAFQANPISALQQHLHNQMAVVKHVQTADEEKRLKKKQQEDKKAREAAMKQPNKGTIRAMVKSHKKF